MVIVGSIGSDLRRDYTAVGDTTNVAAQLQQAADQGQIVISAGTHRLVSGYFEVREIGALSLKGKTESVQAWAVLAARLEVESDRGLTPFVGRDREMSVLLEAFDKAKGGSGQVVFIVGEPGIGKSRLLYEFRHRLGGDPVHARRPTVLPAERVCVGEDVFTPYLVVQDMEPSAWVLLGRRVQCPLEPPEFRGGCQAHARTWPLPGEDRGRPQAPGSTRRDAPDQIDYQAFLDRAPAAARRKEMMSTTP